MVDTRKAIAILAVLAAERRAFARDELAALLWPDADDAAARGAFRRTLSALRAAVGENVLVVDRTRVDLVRDHVRIDLLDLERLAGSADRGGLEHAAALARGPFLAGFSLRDSPDFDDWRAARAITAERTVNTVLDRLSAALEDAGDLPAAIATAGRRVDLDPLDEGAHVRLMDLSAAAGDRAGAMRQYRACVAILERELGVAPLPETAARYEAIRDAVPADPAPRRAAPGRGHRGLPLVGRDRGMATLMHARTAAERDGRVVVLTGEAGIGKTRLAETFVSQARAAGSTVLSARAHAAEQAIAYGPIVELLRAGQADPACADRLRRLDGASLADLARLLPTVEGAARGTDVHGPGAHARLVTAIAEALVAAVSGTRPGIVWVDDVQWVDAESLEALAYLARRLTGRSVVLLLTWRHEELDAAALSFARQVEALSAVTTVQLERLDRDDVEALVAAATGVAEPAASLVDPLVTASEGLPLYVVEVLAGGHTSPDGMPDGVRAVLRQRLATVDGLSEQVLAAAAAIGRSFDLATVRHASGRSEDETVQALDDLLRRGLIRELAERPDPSDAVSGRSATAPTSPVLRYDFAHAALRDLAEASTSLARRRLLHRRIAEALRMDLGGVGRDDLGRLVRIAQHERDAGRDAEAAEAFREAGDRASGLFANVDAISHYAAAVALGHPDVVGLHAAIGGLRTRLGDYAGAIAALEISGRARLAGRPPAPRAGPRPGAFPAWRPDRRGSLPRGRSRRDPGPRHPGADARGPRAGPATDPRRRRRGQGGGCGAGRCHGHGRHRVDGRGAPDHRPHRARSG